MKGIECCGDCVYYNWKKHRCTRGAHVDTKPASEFFADCPLKDVQPVRHGWWKQARYTEAPMYLCSECDKPEYKQHNYCPNCGAKMEVQE